jgi:ketosteroid isomerase-like protein
MQSWIAKRLISYLMERLRAGDMRPILALDAPDVELTFPGDSSWSGVFRGKAEVRRWLERFVASGLQIYADEVVATGMPWNGTICIRGRDHLIGADGAVVYRNRYVIWGRMSWGRLKRYEVYEDTHAANQLDGYLAEHRPDLMPAATAAA